MENSNIQITADENAGGETFPCRPDDVAYQLRSALANQRFTVAYQPQYDLRTGRIVGMEALLRWLSPADVPILPSSFIQVAEETGLILPIGEWILHTACCQVKVWSGAGVLPCRLAINLSPKQFAHADRLVLSALRKSGFDPSLLELEVTEQAVIQDLVQAAKVLTRLHAFGIRVALDDFGTGYSSLQYLDRLPVQTLKIDRCFVSQITAKQKARIITKHIICMAHDLSMCVVAEGVETPAQRDLLKRQGCDLAQGFLYAHPLPEKDMRALLFPAKKSAGATG
ncbi:MAG: EAL domain-containing protein [Ethanoligenens sp.]